MTLKSIMNSMRGSVPNKAPTFDRIIEGIPFPSRGSYGSYQPPPPTYQHHQPPPPPQIIKQLVFSKPHEGSYGGGGGGGHSTKAAMSALTLLSFLFFLNILQQCIRDQMQMANPTVMVMTAGRVVDGDDELNLEPMRDEAFEGVRSSEARIEKRLGQVNWGEREEKVRAYGNETENIRSIFKNLEDFFD